MAPVDLLLSELICLIFRECGVILSGVAKVVTFSNKLIEKRSNRETAKVSKM